MILIIAGPRDWYDPEALSGYLDNWYATRDCQIDHIITGGATGVDTAALYWAKMQTSSIEVIPADWNRYGLSAGPIRNREMVEKADEAVVIRVNKVWSKGSFHLYNTMKQAGKPIHIIEVTL